MAYLRRYLIVFLGLLSWAFAQRDLGDEVELRFVVFSQIAQKGLAYQPAEKAALRELAFFSANRSPEYVYRGGRLLRFYAKDGGAAPELVAACTIPAGMQKALLLFVPIPDPLPNGPRFRVIAVDDSEQRVPRGHFAFLNVSGRGYTATYGGAALRVPVGVSEAFRGGAAKYLRLLAEIDGEPVTVGGLNFGLDGDNRGLVVIFPPARKTGVQPQMRVLHDEAKSER